MFLILESVLLTSQTQTRTKKWRTRSDLKSLVDEFNEGINQGSQHQDDDSSTGTIRSNSGSRDCKKSFSNKTGSIRRKELIYWTNQKQHWKY